MQNVMVRTVSRRYPELRREMHARKSGRPSKVSKSDVVLKVRTDIVVDPLKTPLGERVDGVRRWHKIGRRA